ncbi:MULTISPECIES: CaiB/BaiF CoA transferase family protein [Nocardiaceae]|nr:MULTISPECIES: CoA transferase [Rhodococcus]
MTAAGPLTGIRVLDFTTTFSGPYCTQSLSDLGADVIKVEAPSGDITRRLGTIREGMGSVYAACNRDKASIEIDMAGPEHAKVIELVDSADCLVHNMRPAAARKLGIDAVTTLERNPRLIHASITGYGTNGLYAGRPAYDDCIQAASGLAALQSDYAGQPQYMATSIADKVAGMTAAQAILAALFARERTGRGQAVEIPMYETLVGFTLMEQWGGQVFDPPTGPPGYARMQSRFRKPYRTADSSVAVVVYHQGHWERFLEAVGRSEVLADPRFSSVEARNRNIDSLYAILEAILTERTTEQWLDLFSRIDVPAAPVLDLNDVLSDPHLESVDFFQTVTSESGSFVANRSSMLFSDTPLADPRNRPGPSRLDSGRDAAERWSQATTPV